MKYIYEVNATMCTCGYDMKEIIEFYLNANDFITENSGFFPDDDIKCPECERTLELEAGEMTVEIYSNDTTEYCDGCGAIGVIEGTNVCKECDV